MLTWIIGLALAGEVSLEDKYQWLEDVTGEKPLEWVEIQNKASLSEIQGISGYADLEARLLSIYDSTDRIPYVTEIGGYYYNLWQDAANPRGLWRRTTPEEFAKAAPAWHTVNDLDALSAAEGKAWVWHGANCLAPEYQRCLVSLSDGGKDADFVREYDLSTQAFVADGFVLPEAKGGADWSDKDTLLVSLAQGEGTETDSGYPRKVQLWKRGTPLTEAPVIFEGQTTDVSSGAYRDATPGFEREFVYRSPSFFTQETWLRKDGTLTKLDVPESANASPYREWLLIELREDWTVGGQTYTAGSLLSAPFDKYMAGERALEVLFAPTDRVALSGTATTKDAIVLTVLDNVRSKVRVLTRDGGAWKTRELGGLPEFASISVSPVDSYTSNQAFLTITDFVTPTTLSVVDITSGAAPTPLKSLPAFYDASKLQIQQFEATSLDGTKVPYFMVSRKGLKLNGKNPTLLYGYGGFEVSLTPSYNSTAGAAWLEKGGVYVLANIRGGGEFGPKWHQSALKENRHKAYEDFAAVADDLVKRKITTPKHLGAMGGSNGGLLMGNMLTQYSEKFGAIVCQVPLLDMYRYNTLLAGASWMGEYGDPSVPEEWKFIQTFSPYHLAVADRKYPRTFFTTSTKDDRVHPGHARKMVARLKEMGHDVVYWENTEGGHGGAATNADRAKMWAMSWTFLWNELK